jgi:hypothetical protein
VLLGIVEAGLGLLATFFAVAILLGLSGNVTPIHGLPGGAHLAGSRGLV